MTPTTKISLLLVASLLLIATHLIGSTSQQQQPQLQPPPPSPQSQPLPQHHLPTPLARSPCPHAIRINTNYQFRGTLHFICLQATAQRPRLDVIQYSNQQVVLSRDVDEFGTTQLASFVDDEGILRIIVAAPNRINGTSIYSLDSDGKFIEEKHTINTQFVGTLSIWKLELNWEWQLAILNKPNYMPKNNHHGQSLNINQQPDPLEPRPMISIHSWRSTYFDSYQLISLPYDGRVNKLEPMHINDQEFLIVAMESHKHDNYPQSGNSKSITTNSLIYVLDFGDGTLNWKHYQYFDTEFAIDVSSFAITHKESLQKDYYIAFLGQAIQKSDNGAAGVSYQSIDSNQEFGLLIYKYIGDQFVRVHSIAAPGSTRLDTISYGIGDSYVIIALLNGWSNQISLFLYDGLSPESIPGPDGSAKPQTYQYRQRRTMNEFNNLHLFMVPTQTSIANDSSDISVKRTLDDSQPAITLPALAFSNTSPSKYSIDGQSIDAASGLPSSETLYQIPIGEIIKSNDELKISTVGTTNDFSHTKRTFVDTGQDLLGWCKATINSILNDNFEIISKQFLSLPRIDQAEPIELSGNLLIDGDLHVSNLLYVNHVKEQYGPQQVIIDSRPLNLSQTYHDIEQAHQDIDALNFVVDQILVDDDSIQEVYAPLRFERVIIECLSPINLDPRLRPQLPFLGGNCPQIGEIRTTRLNSHDITDIQRQALLTGRSMTIARDVRFEHLILQGNTQILDTLNDIQIQDIVFGRGQSTGSITGHKRFLNGLFSTTNLLVDKWNSYQINRQTVLTSSGEQRIDANLRFSRVVIDSNIRHGHYNVSSRIETLNGKHLDTHLGQIAVANANNHFDIPLHFSELILDGPVYFPANSHLSSIDLENMWRTTMFKHSHQNISAPMEFIGDVHVSHGGDIIVGGPINGVILTRDNVLMKNRNYDISNPIVFRDSVTMNRLEIFGTLNGIESLPNDETRRYELAILYNGGTQYLSGDKIFNEIHLGGESYINGLINGHLNLTHLHNLLVNNNEPYRFSTVRLSGSNIRISDSADFTINSLINDIPVDEICSLAIHASRSTSNQYRRLKFDSPAGIAFKSLRCASINGFRNLTNSFLTRYGDQHVHGTLRLVNGVIFNTTINISQNLNGLGVTSLSEAIEQSIQESRTGHKDIYGDFIVDDLYVERINDLYLPNVFITKSDSPQIIRAPMIFDHLDIENILIVKENLYSNSFNDLNLTDLITNTLQYDAPQIIYNHVILKTLQLLPGSNLLTKSLNGFDMRLLYSDAVLWDIPQQILGPKTFRSPVEFRDKVLLRYGIDGLSENELRFNLLLQSDELIDDDLEFHNEVTVLKELEIQSGVINDIDLSTFVNSMLHENMTDKVGLRIFGNTSVRFKDVKVNNLIVSGTVQGIDISRDAILKSDSRVAPAPLSKPTPATPPAPPPLQHSPSALGQQQSSQPQLVLPRPLSLISNNQIQSTWTPDFSSPNVTKPSFGALKATTSVGNNFPLIDPVYLEHQASLKAQAIRDLAMRMNKYLATSFYYEIVQKHPLLGPLLHAASNPILNEKGSALLLLKATSKLGEPCLLKGQTVAVMTRQHPKSSFTLDSRIQETSNPSLVESLIVGQAHYLFILDSYAEGTIETMSQILIYLWDYRSGMYDLKQRLPNDGFPTSMKAFVANNIGCLVLANPRVIYTNHSGAPVMYCQTTPIGEFNHKILLPMQNVFDLDVAPLASGVRFMIAALSQQDTEQIGDLIVGIYDIPSGIMRNLVYRRTIRPLKLHFIRRPSAGNLQQLNLVVSEALTGNDDTQAITRIFTLPVDSNLGSLLESQIIKDKQFFDIQSVLLDNRHSMLFLQSTHSIAIYAPNVGQNEVPGCEAQFNLIQRLPSKGANKLLAFNSHHGVGKMAPNEPYEHYLVLSRDDCEHRQYSTLILKAKFVNK